MKRLLLFSAAIGFGLSVSAQQSANNASTLFPQPSSNLQVAKPKAPPVTGEEDASQRAAQPKVQKAPAQPAPTETVIGVTTYDLQSNSSIQNRIKNHGDGTISACWTYSESGDLAASDRGSGYQYFDGTNWMAQPTARVEQVRVGWPSMVANPTLGERLIAHTVNEDINHAARNTVGAGSWNETLLPGPVSLWPRSASNGNTIHSWSITTPVANGGTVYQNQDGAMTYSRSLDGGATWDIQKVVPGDLDDSNSIGFGGDGYAIAEPVGDTAAFAIFDQWQDGVLMKTTDNGTTWTKTIFNDFPLDLFDPAANGSISDINNDAVADTINTTDDAGAVLLDHNGMAHVFFGNMRVLDDDAAGAGSFFPATNGLMYWNESFGTREPVMISGALDWNQNGGIDIVGNSIDGIASYFISLSGQPSAGIADDGCIYVVFSAHMETLDQTVQNYRHLHMIRSCDGGCSWTEPIDLNDGSAFTENVFASVARKVDTNVHLVYQQDDEPGLSVRGDEDAFRDNDIIYMSVPTTDLDAAAIAVCNTFVDGASELCLGDSTELTASCGSAYQWFKNGSMLTGETNGTLWADDHATYTVDITTPCGVITDTLVISAPSAAPTFELDASEDEICIGDMSVLSVSNVSGGGASYLWSNGATTASTTVSDTGTYMVTVSNCGGTTTESISIALPSVPTASITGNNQICDGDSVMLSAASQPSATYAWSTMDSTQSIYVDATGTYTLYVTNCGGTDSTDITISNVPPPAAFVNQDGPGTFCEGEDDVVLSTLSGDAWLWSNGATTQSISLDAAGESGMYNVTVYNSCGDSTVSAPAIDITINAAPAAPTITQSGLTFTCNETGSAYQWYINGIPLSGETNQTYTAATWATIDGKDVSCVYTDGNGCDSPASNVISGLGDGPSGAAASFDVFPNPNEGAFTVSFSNFNNARYTISVRNVLGQTVYNEARTVSGNQNVAINLTNFDKGMYFVTVSSANGEATKRVVVK